MAFDAVPIDTPASRATSRIVCSRTPSPPGEARGVRIGSSRALMRSPSSLGGARHEAANEMALEKQKHDQARQRHHDDPGFRRAIVDRPHRLLAEGCDGERKRLLLRVVEQNERSEEIVPRRKEGEQTRTLESRRQLVEAATREFEGAVANIVQTLDRAAEAMDRSARDMASTAGRNQEQALATAAASEEATTNVGIVATAAEEIAQSIEHIAARVANSATVASQASGEAKAITDAVESLSASVDEIGEVSDLISSIAAQTNLLALNATIEAARAGEAGRGFAVVAQEVKGLATQTGKATGEITRHIVSIEQTTERSVQAIKKIATTIAQLSENAGDVAVAMRQQDSVTQEIARNAGAAAKGTRDVAENIGEVSNSAVKTGQVASTVLTAAAELAEQSHQLRREVERYLAQLRVA